MHCIEPGKDAYYDLQMVPLKAQPRQPTSAEAVRWGVFAQYSRNGEPFKWATKIRDVSKITAFETFKEVKEEREDHGYVEVAKARESDLLDKQSEIATELLAGLPVWESFPDLVLQAASLVTEALGPERDFSMGTVVILADLAFSCPDGLIDAIPMCAAVSTIDSLFTKLTPDIRHWLLAQYPGAAGLTEAKVGNDLIQLCNDLEQVNY
jgi:hypothetical protein